MGLYDSLEEKYYALMEKLHLIDVFVRPIEERGIPSFPIAVLIILLLLVGIGFGAWTLLNPAAPEKPGGGAFKITVRAASGELIDGALVEVWDGSDKVGSKTTKNGIALFDSLPKKTLTLRVTKEGFETKEEEVDFTELMSYTVSLESVEGATPTPPSRVWENADPDEETLEASLDVYVKNPEGRGIDAIVRVYDAGNSVQIGDDLLATGGHATMDGLEKGQRVYLVIEPSESNALKYLPYDGSREKTTLKAGINPITKTLRRAVWNAPNNTVPDAANLTTITVRDSSGVVARALVSVFKRGQTAVISTKLTDANGTAQFVLTANLSIDYYATVNKTNYFPAWSSFFKAGDNVTIALTPVTNETKAALTVRVFDEKDGKPVLGASYGVYREAAGQEILLCRGTTTSNGTGYCPGLERGRSVTVRASKGARSTADETVALTAAENSVELTLLLPRAKLVCTALDVVTNDPIASAQFAVFYNGTQVGSCSGEACEIVVPATVQLNLRANAPDYTSAEVPVTAAANENKSVSVLLFPLDTVNESKIVLQKVIDASTGLDVSSLRLGHSYVFVFTLAGHGGDATGAFFSVGDASVAAIAGHLQLGVENVGSTTDTCAPEEVDYASGKRYAWIDVNYYSAGREIFTKTMLLNVTVSETAALDPQTHEAKLALFYRSYVKRGNAIFRNPYDEALGARIDSPLPSGCLAATLEADYNVYSPATTCQRGVCVTLEFSQDGKSGPNEGFPAKSMLNLLDSGTGAEPLVVRYKIEIFDDLREHSVLAFRWNDANAAELIKVSTPLQMEDPVNRGTWICGGARDYWFPTPNDDVRAGEFAVYADGTGFVLNLDKLRRCSNYAPPKRVGKPFVARGTVYLKTLQTNPKVDVSARFASGSRRPPFWAVVIPPISVSAEPTPPPWATITPQATSTTQPPWVTVTPVATSAPPTNEVGAVDAPWVRSVAADEVESFVKDAAPNPAGCYCDAAYDPVCGTDGETYGNACEAKCAGASIAYKGQCVSAGAECAVKCARRFAPYCDSSAAPPKLYYSECLAKCDAATGAAPGVCGACYAYYDPVCGSDDKTYFNDCTAQLANVPVKRKGACRTSFVEYLFANHTTWFSVEGNGTYASDYATVELQFEQNATPANLTKKDSGVGMFEAQSIEDCLVCPNNLTYCDERDKIVAANCTFSPVKIHFRIKLRKSRDDNAIYLETTPDFLKLKEGGAYYYVGKEKTPRIARNWFLEGFNDDVGSLAKGTVIEGKAVAFPLKQGQSPVRAGHVMQDTRDPNAPFKTELERWVYVTKKPAAPTTQLIPFKYTNDLLDSCNGAVGVLYDPSMSPEQSLRLANDCFSVQMRVSPILPGDAIPVRVDSSTPLFAKIVAGDADSEGCYETCDYTATNSSATGKTEGKVGNCRPGIGDAFTKKGVHLLRYNAELDSCPKKFQLIANTINGSWIKVELRAPGSNEAVKTISIYVDGAENYPCIVIPETAQCVSRGPVQYNCYYDAKEKACKIKYNNDPTADTALPRPINPRNAWTWGKGLYIARVVTHYRIDYAHAETTKEWPELWVVVNHKQIGSRDIAIVDRLAEQPASVLSSDGLALDLPIVHFDGPGVKVFAWVPRPGRRMIAYEKREPIFYSDYDLRDPVQWLDDSNEYTESTLPAKSVLNVDADTYELLRTNALYVPEAAEIVVGRGQRLANTTAFWRSLESTKFCYCPTLPCDIDQRQLADANICKPSLEDWRVYDVNTSMQYHGCTFCNNTAFPISPDNDLTCDSPQEEQIASGHLPCTYNTNIDVFDCDERCVKSDPSDPESPGMAFVKYGDVIDENKCELADYNSAHPISSILKSEVEACQSNGACPLVLDESAVPQCFKDQDGDGYYTEADVEADPELKVSPAKLNGYSYDCEESGEIIAVGDFCNMPCMNWCTPREDCSIACSVNGTLASGSATVKTQTGWYDENGEIALDSEGNPDLEWGLRNVKPVVVRQPDAPTLWHAPMSYFSDYREPQFEYSFVTNAVNKHDSFFNLSSIQSVKGCNDLDHKRYEEQGIYEIKEHNDLDLYKITGEEQWKGEAAVLTLAREDYLGGRCNKPAAWNKVELCNPMFPDNTGWNSYWKFGNCINTIYQYEAGSTGSLVKKVLWGRLASTQMKDVFDGFVISPQGYIVTFANYSFKGAAIFQPYYTNFDQVFEYWTPDGKAHLFTINHRKVHWGKILTIGGAILAAAVVGFLTAGAGWATIPVILVSAATGGAVVGLTELLGAGCWGGNTGYQKGLRESCFAGAAAPPRSALPALLAALAVTSSARALSFSDAESQSQLLEFSSLASCTEAHSGHYCMDTRMGDDCRAGYCPGSSQYQCCIPKSNPGEQAGTCQAGYYYCMDTRMGDDCVSGLCPGGSDFKCCKPKAAETSTATATANATATAAPQTGGVSPGQTGTTPVPGTTSTPTAPAVTPEANKPEAEPNKFNWNAAWGGALNGALAGGVVGGALLYLEYATCTMPAWLKGCTDAKETPLTDSDAGETDVVLTSCIGPNWKVALNEVPPNQAEERPPATAEGNQ